MFFSAAQRLLGVLVLVVGYCVDIVGDSVLVSIRMTFSGRT